MKRMVIFEPAMCCSTGVCGPSVNPELLRVATVLNTLRKNGIMVVRNNLASNPRAFVINKKIESLMRQDPECLPVVMLDGEIVKTKGYPTNAEFAAWLGVPESMIFASKAPGGGCGCGPQGCC
jgi:hypothetical protein